MVLPAAEMMIRPGGTLAMVDVLLYSDGVDDPVAQSTVTYAIPRSNL